MLSSSAERVVQSPMAASLACSGQVVGSVIINKLGFASFKISRILLTSVAANCEKDSIPASLSIDETILPIPMR